MYLHQILRRNLFRQRKTATNRRDESREQESCACVLKVKQLLQVDRRHVELEPEDPEDPEGVVGVAAAVDQ